MKVIHNSHGPAIGMPWSRNKIVVIDAYEYFCYLKRHFINFVCFMQFNLVNNQEQVVEFVQRGVA